VQVLEGDYLRMHQELFTNSDSKAAYSRLTDFVDGEPDGVTKTFFLKLPWFFEGKPHLAIPLVAAQYHGITIVLHLAKSVAGVSLSTPPLVRLFVEYAFLATQERRRVATIEHTFVIEQIQYQSTPLRVTSVIREHKVPLSFNHPARWLCWNFGNSREPARYTGSQAGETNEATGVLQHLTLTLNGTDRFERRRAAYFNSFTPSLSLAAASQPRAGIYFYSFNMRPQSMFSDYAADSSLNFSRIDAPVLHFATKAANAASVSAITHSAMTLATGQELDMIRVYAATVQILSVRQGMFQLRYAN
jgi:hypothetical protein